MFCSPPALPVAASSALLPCVAALHFRIRRPAQEPRARSRRRLWSTWSPTWRSSPPRSSAATRQTGSAKSRCGPRAGNPNRRPLLRAAIGTGDHNASDQRIDYIITAGQVLVCSCVLAALCCGCYGLVQSFTAVMVISVRSLPNPPSMVGLPAQHAVLLKLLAAGGAGGEQRSRGRQDTAFCIVPPLTLWRKTLLFAFPQA